MQFLSRFSIVIISIFYSVICFSQEKDTIYYDKYWNKSLKKEAHFYRPLPLKKVGNLYRINDFFADGNLQMTAFSKSEKDDIFHGKAIWYYQNGQKMLEQNFEDGKLNDIEISYFRDGKQLSKGNYINGVIQNGTFYLSNTAENKSATYEDKILVAYNAFYENEKTIAKKTFYDVSRQYLKTIYYNKDGSKIVEAKEYNRREKDYIGAVKCFYKTNPNNNILEIIYIKYLDIINDKRFELLQDTKGKTIAKGELKNGKPYSGKFFQDNKLITYFEGVKDGEAIFYDKSFNKVATGIYKNGYEFSGDFYNIHSEEIHRYKDGKVALKQSKNKFTDEIYECTFNDYTPIDGQYFSYNTLTTYMNGFTSRVVTYDIDSGKKEAETFYKENDYNITKKIFFQDKAIDTLIYKNGIPFSGREINRYGYITHENGYPNGPFLIESTTVINKGNYKNGYKEDGKIVYIRPLQKDTLTCFFKDGKPIDGTKFYLNNLTRYKNGKKEGCSYKTFNNRRYEYDSLSICYTNDIPVGTAKYYLKEKLVATADYKEGEPFHGTFYDSRNKQVLENGKLIQKVIANARDFYKTQFFEDEKLVKEYVSMFAGDTVNYNLKLKKEKPFEGVGVRYDSIERNNTITHYENGKKSGLQTVYKSYGKDFESKVNYKNDKREGKAIFKPFENDSIYTAVFKNDMVIDGVILNTTPDVIEKKEFENSKLIKSTYFTKYSPKVISKVFYKKEKPYQGYEICYDKKKRRTVKYYENGVLKATYLNAYGNDYNNTEPQSRYKVIHNVLKDSVISTNNYNNLNLSINYTSEEKKSGDVTFYQSDSIVGSAAFKNKNITALDFTKSRRNREIETIRFNGKIFTHSIQLDDFKASFESKNTSLESPIYEAFIDKTRTDLASDASTVINLYLGSETEVPVSTLIVKDGKPYDGLFFTPDREGTYGYLQINNGIKVEEKKGITKQELLEKLKKEKE